MNYKFHLDKSSKKFYCPNCKKKTFVRYVDSETQQYMDSHLGRCDRESKCRYHCSPKGNQPIVQPKGIPNITKPDYHDFSLVEKYTKDINSNNLVKALLNMGYKLHEFESVFNSYYIGTSGNWEGDTIFWQVDENKIVHGGKVMLYDEHTTKRVKIPYPCITWMHTVLQKSNPVLQGKTFNLEQCLFGLHRLNDSLDKTIAIVESEKTAVMMSIIRPDMLWMATGSKSNFKYKLLKPLKGRKIEVFPDKSEFLDWRRKADEMRLQGLNIWCSEFLEHSELEEGSDLADYFFALREAA